MEQWHIGAVGPDFDLSFVQRCLIAGRAPWFYAGKLLWPHPLIFVYPRWRIDDPAWYQYLFPVSAVALISVLWLARRRLGRGPLVAVLFFVGTLFPALGFVNVYPMQFSFVADHFQYLASIGLIACFAAVVWPRLPPRWAVAAPAALLMALGILTWTHAWTYEDAETLWRDTIAQNPAAWIAHNNLGAILVTQGKLAEAADEYAAALKDKPDHLEALVNLGSLLAEQGQLDQGILHLRAAVRYQPLSPDAHYYLGNALAKRAELAEATTHYREATQLRPQNPYYYLALAQCLEEQHLMDEATAAYRDALTLKTSLTKARDALARLAAATQPVTRPGAVQSPAGIQPSTR